ncbi:hypothetical protein HDU67_009924 [Dinochytrium kinnereticum]|nr:hypothetical protein HDU67_009924 [Dinochytrium kinnereticum]
MASFPGVSVVPAACQYVRWYKPPRINAAGTLDCIQTCRGNRPATDPFTIGVSRSNDAELGVRIACICESDSGIFLPDTSPNGRNCSRPCSDRVGGAGFEGLNCGFFIYPLVTPRQPGTIQIYNIVTRPNVTSTTTTTTGVVTTAPPTPPDPQSTSTSLDPPSSSSSLLSTDSTVSESSTFSSSLTSTLGSSSVVTGLDGLTSTLTSFGSANGPTTSDTSSPGVVSATNPPDASSPDRPVNIPIILGASLASALILAASISIIYCKIKNPRIPKPPVVTPTVPPPVFVPPSAPPVPPQGGTGNGGFGCGDGSGGAGGGASSGGGGEGGSGGAPGGGGGGNGTPTSGGGGGGSGGAPGGGGGGNGTPTSGGGGGGGGGSGGATAPTEPGMYHSSPSSSTPAASNPTGPGAGTSPSSVSGPGPAGPSTAAPPGTSPSSFPAGPSAPAPGGGVGAPTAPTTGPIPTGGEAGVGSTIAQPIPGTNVVDLNFNPLDPQNMPIIIPNPFALGGLARKREEDPNRQNGVRSTGPVIYPGSQYTVPQNPYSGADASAYNAQAAAYNAYYGYGAYPQQPHGYYPDGTPYYHQQPLTSPPRSTFFSEGSSSSAIISDTSSSYAYPTDKQGSLFNSSAMQPIESEESWDVKDPVMGAPSMMYRDEKRSLVNLESARGHDEKRNGFHYGSVPISSGEKNLHVFPNISPRGEKGMLASGPVPAPRGDSKDSKGAREMIPSHPIAEVSMEDATQWTSIQVARWLAEQGHSTEVVSAFAQKKINGGTLFELDDNQLQAGLGINQSDVRDTILRAVDGIRPMPPAYATMAGADVKRMWGGDVKR